MDSSPLQTGINDLEAKAQASPYDSEIHDALLVLLRAVDDPARLFRAHVHRTNHILPSPQYVTAWEHDISKIQDLLLRNTFLGRFWPSILLDYPVSKYWAAYLLFVLGSSSATSNPILIQAIIEEARVQCAYDYPGSSLVWQYVFEYYDSKLSLVHGSALWPQVLEVYMDRLSLPHSDMENTLSRLSTLVLTHAPQEYDQIMLKASKKASATQKRQRHIELAESKLSKDIPCSWKKYIEETARYARDWSEVSCVFNRYLALEAADNPNMEQQLDVWRSYINLMIDYDLEGSLFSELHATLTKFMRAFPSCPRIYPDIITWCELLPDSIDILDKCLNMIESIGIMERATSEDVDEIVIDLCAYHSRTNKQSTTASELDSFRSLVSYYTDLVAGREEIGGFCALRVILSLLIQKNDIELAENMVKMIVQAHPDSCDAWLLGTELYTTANTDTLKVLRFFELALDRAPSQELIDKYRIYTATHSNSQQVVIAKRMCRLAADRITASCTSDKDPESRSDSKGEDSSVFAATIPEPVEPTRSRENLCVKVTVIGHDTDQTDVLDFFADCGNVISCYRHENNGTLQYTLEFSDENQVFLALTKNLKVFKGHQINVARLLQSTLFVTNYPPTMRQDQIKDLFASVGTVSNIRFPTQRPGYPSRRFCYIEYGDSTIAHAAVTLFDKRELVDSETGKPYQLKVSISRPDERGTRKARFSDRKVRITNLPFTLTEDQIREVFGNFGSIESINLPRTRRDRNAGHHNDGVAMILYLTCEDADRAASAGSVPVCGRQANVHKQSQDAGNYHLPEPNGAKMIRIENVDETLTVEQCRASIEKKVGRVTLMQLGPDSGMATISFESAKEAGQGALLLENYTLGTKQIKVIPGTHSKKAAARTQKLMVPTNLKRKRIV